MKTELLAMAGLNPRYIGDMKERQEGGDGSFCVGKEGVEYILATADEKAEFILYRDKALAYVRSQMGYPAIYPLKAPRFEAPPLAVLMDLDGTSVRSESFWVWIIERTTAALLGDESFAFEEEDAPYVSGHSVSEHLQHCLRKYCPEKSIVEARNHYFEITHREMEKILAGKGRDDAFVPAPGLKPFLLAMKEHGIKIGLVTSGLYEKAWPEIVAAFRQMELGEPTEFYDAIITAGQAPRSGQVGTLGELEAKPHPWLYAETACVGLGIDPSQSHRVVGLEDSGPGIVSLRLAGFTAIGVEDGNIASCGTLPLVHTMCKDLNEACRVVLGA